MAVITTHVLNSVDGTHAAGMRIDLYKIDPSGHREVMFSAATDGGGRLRESVALEATDTRMNFELIFHTAEYFTHFTHVSQQSAQRTPAVNDKAHILREVVFRFSMPDPDACYHIPMMLAPSGYSIWCAG